MFRTHTCGELRLSDASKTVTLAGWVQRTRDLGGMTFVDLRDRYGITQLTFNTDSDATLRETARTLGREFVVQVTGKVIERQSKNANMPTGEVEIFCSELKVLNGAKTPPFTIEDETDGGDELRMKYRYLDLRRNNVRTSASLNFIGYDLARPPGARGIPTRRQTHERTIKILERPRREDKDTALWQPTVTTDARGHARVSFVMPDSLTRWRVTVRGMTAAGVVSCSS